MTTLQSFKARTGEPFGAPQLAHTPAQVDAAVQAAHDAFVTWSCTDGATRSALLYALADALDSDRSDLIQVADEETALGTARLNGELDRTIFQLKRFGDMAARGVPFAMVDEPAVAGAPPFKSAASCLASPIVKLSMSMYSP